MKRPKLSAPWILVYIIVFTLVLAGWKSLTPEPRSYNFVTSGHPVDMWQDSKDKWAYYSLGPGKVKDLADRVRSELVPLGFTEDTSAKPWFRFIKGNEEVIACNHQEFAVNRLRNGQGHLVKPSPSPGIPPTPTQEWPCILVKNGPGTNTSLRWFEIKKVVRGW